MLGWDRRRGKKDNARLEGDLALLSWRQGIAKDHEAAPGLDLHGTLVCTYQTAG